MSNYKMLTEQERRELFELWQNGEPATSLAKKYNISRETANKILKRGARGEFEIRKTGRPSVLTDTQKAWAIEQKRKGYTAKAIAAALNVSLQVISYITKGTPKNKTPLHYDFEKEGA